MTIILNENEYRDRVLGCWMGKNIGGTLGAPFEWRRQINNVSFYIQDLGGEALPNDDLDIQLLWLIALEERGLEIDAHTLADYWCLYVTPHWAEYGNAKINLRSGLVPPLSGTLNNEFKDSCGAFIRSEIWACIAPGCPQKAVEYAFQDAILDHGDGEGTYAEVFTAALESAAFVVDDLQQLIEIGLSYIPEDCGVAGAVRGAIASYQGGKTWQEARDAVLAGYRGSSFFNIRSKTSEEDWAKGFGEGKLGWDAPSNLGMLVIGLLYGEGDFERSICTAVNCGEDTDCTAATAGSIFGIMHGIQAIPKRWIQPIGRKIKTACLNLGELGGYGGLLPATVDEMTHRTERIARQVLVRHKLPVELSPAPSNIAEVSIPSQKAGYRLQQMYANLKGPLYRFDFFEVIVDYGAEGPLIQEGVARPITLHIYNRYRVQASLNLHWYTPEDWQVMPSQEAYAFSAQWREPLALTFQVVVGKVTGSTQRVVVEITLDGRPTVMLVPVVFKNGAVVKN